jgi:hypothetical protein
MSRTEWFLRPIPPLLVKDRPNILRPRKPVAGVLVCEDSLSPEPSLVMKIKCSRMVSAKKLRIIVCTMGCFIAKATSVMVLASN